MKNEESDLRLDGCKLAFVVEIVNQTGEAIS